VAIDLSALRAELDADPRGLGYAGKTVHELKPIINGNPETVSRPISPGTLWEWFDQHSRLVALGVARTDAALTVEQRNAAQGVWYSLGGDVVDEVTRGELPQSIDLTSSPFIHAVSLVVAADVLSAVQGAAVLALGDVSLPRDEALGFGHVRESYITAALAL
jgi:hypothetical protein